MATTTKSDKYPNLFSLTISQGAANTLTYAQLAVAGSVFDKRAMIVHRLEYNFGLGLAAALTADGDEVFVGLAVSRALSGVTGASDLDDPAIVTRASMRLFLQGAGTNTVLERYPLVSDFSYLPGGGLIVPISPIYGFIAGQSAVNPLSVNIRGYYTTLDLKPDEYWELVESRRILTTSL